jgi:uncharacterized protein YceK
MSSPRVGRFAGLAMVLGLMIVVYGSACGTASSHNQPTEKAERRSGANPS